MAYSYINQDKDLEPNLQSLYALEYLRHKVVAGLGIQLLPSLLLDVNYRYQYRMGTFTDAQGHTYSYRPYSLVDARLAWSKPAYTLYVEANNLFDKDYRDYGFVKQPGFWLIAGVKVKIG